MDKQQVPEGQINQQTLQQVAPDIAGQEGQGQLFQKAVQAHVAKKQLDAVMEAVATHLGAATSSRVKNIETASKKIAQKRLEGRKDYDIDSVNDFLGSRLVIKSDNDLSKAINAVKKLSEAGIFTTDKSERVKKGSYSAWHIDITMNNGTKAEIQIMNRRQEAESLINHSLRSQYGENPNNDAVRQFRDKQASIVKSLPNEKAEAVSGAMKNIMQQNKDQPIHPQVTASLLSQAK